VAARNTLVTLFWNGEPKMYVGTIAGAGSRFHGFTLFVTFMICTGFALYSEGTGMIAGSTNCWVGVCDLAQQPGRHTWHHLGMWALQLSVVA